MKRLLPHPILAAILLVLWLVLQQSIGLGHIILGGIIAVLASLAANAVLTEPVIVKRPLKLMQLVAVAGVDVVRSNLAVLMVLLNPNAKPTAGFIEMQLELTNRFGLAVLACLLTATPGSAWLEHNAESNTVLIHVFDLKDEAKWVRTVKKRYESLLLEIFQ
jgi:multicomponent K+:H+ antiporter subunit E